MNLRRLALTGTFAFHVVSLVTTTNSNSFGFGIAPPLQAFRNSARKSLPPIRFQNSDNADDSSFVVETTELASPPSTWKSALSQNEDFLKCVDELFPSNEKKEAEIGGQELYFLFVGPYHADNFANIVKEASRRVDGTLISILGGGVIGQGVEVEGETTPSLSILGGILPEGARIHATTIEDPKDLNSIQQKHQNDDSSSPRGVSPSYMIWSDPQATMLDQVLQSLEGRVVVGGVTVPPTKASNQPSIAINDAILSPGSILSLECSGTFGLSSIVTQGCQPIAEKESSDFFVVTEVVGGAIAKLNDTSAIEQLEKTVSMASKEIQDLVRENGVLGGILDLSSSPSLSHSSDFVIHQVIGYRPQSGSILMSGSVKEGDIFQFHVKSAESAQADFRGIIRRAQTERLVLGTKSLGDLVGAVQVSSIARGEELYGKPNIDVQFINSLFEGTADACPSGKSDSAPIAGCFTSGELGSAGIHMGSSSQSSSSFPSTSKTHLFGCTTVAILLCDHSRTSSRRMEEDHVILDAEHVPTLEDAWG